MTPVRANVLATLLVAMIAAIGWNTVQLHSQTDELRREVVRSGVADRRACERDNVMRGVTVSNLTAALRSDASPEVLRTLRRNLENLRASPGVDFYGQTDC